MVIVFVCMASDIWPVYTYGPPTEARDFLLVPDSPREPYFTWVIKNTEFVVYCKHTHTQREDGKMVSIGVTQRRCLTSGCWLSMVNFPQSSFDEETPHVPQQWNFSPHNLHIQSYLPGALNFLKLMLTRTKWMTVGQFFSPLFGLKT